MATKITCVVDYALDQPSGLLGEHGLSIWIETSQGNVLYDTGKTAPVFSNNLEQLGLDPGRISAVALSHGHSDHTGGLEYLLSRAEGFPLYAHADIFRPRFAKRESGFENIGIPLDRESIARKVELKLGTEPAEILPNLWTTGSIQQRPEPEGSAAHLFIPGEAGYVPDIYLDDLSLVLKTPQGLVLITGCCHAGLLNTLHHVESTFGSPVLAVMGGTHLISASDDYLTHILEVFRSGYPEMRFHFNHCTGEKAIQLFAAAFGERAAGFRVGTTVTFAD